ncbi:GDSL-type esterase/lipase family protein [Rathayibacter sp. SD072]|uniref:GDSL-type esterase/lipase family protein n=1 Tax=Rathayibacter sp. SD072 TaxID=2781731 RepID=UPI001A95B661|nr:GDSL-type esterase/lipase family protein [Rathayibacter sp. SD072]MBO0982615.1 hypothetical protein [Rathayibacter sp. SD072]
MKATQFTELTPAPGAHVFLGDSITEGGAWHEWFPEHHVVNRGIGGDTTAGVLQRLSPVTACEPETIFLLIGTNDLGLGRSVDETAAGTRAIIQQLRQDAPDARLVLQSVLPRRAKFADRIRALNLHYRTIAKTSGSDFLDLWPALAAGDELRADATLDGLHLTGTAYREWVGMLRPFLP